MMDTAELAEYLRNMPRSLSEREVWARESSRDAERGVYVNTGRHAEYGAAQH